MRDQDPPGFLEWAEVHGNMYGTSVGEEVERQQQNGLDVVLDIDVQGAVQGARPDRAGDHFIAPPSIEELERRLRGRGSETEAAIALRLHNAREELVCADTYEYLIINDRLEDAVESLKSIIIAERSRHRHNPTASRCTGAADGGQAGVNSRPREKVAAEAADAERLWGINSVWEALQQNGRGLEEVLIERGKAGPRLQQIIDLARQQGVSVRFVETDRLGVPAPLSAPGRGHDRARRRSCSWRSCLMISRPRPLRRGCWPWTASRIRATSAPSSARPWPPALAMSS